VPDVNPGEHAYVQIRVWDIWWGATYEEARARGGKFGASPVVIASTTASPVNLPTLAPLQSFALRAAVPQFTTGRIELQSKTPDGIITWNLAGAPGFTYLVEKRQPPQNWAPLIVLTNITGSVSFSDPDPSNSSVTFYRARMLD
jgi:hypothetical protein